MTQNTLHCVKAVAFALFALAMAKSANAQLDAVMSAQAGANQAAEASQQRVEKLADEGLDLSNRYRRTLSDADSIKRYADELGRQVQSQSQEIAKLHEQLGEVDTVARDVYPLMQKMVASLAEFVALDVPFLAQERSERVNRLKELMNAGDVTVSEKYRRIMEAYGIEMEYGRTIDSVEGTIGEGDAQKAVEFVRIGRIALLYQTLDGKETGYWDKEQKSWVQDNDYRRDFIEALNLAEEKGAPDLLFVPVPAAKEVQS